MLFPADGAERSNQKVFKKEQQTNGEKIHYGK